MRKITKRWIVLFTILFVLGYGKKVYADPVIEGSGLSSAYDIINMQEESLSCDQADIEQNKTAVEDGLLLKGLNQEFSQASFTMERSIDFGDDTVGRIEIDALAKKSTKTKLSIYLDTEETPIVEATIPCQGISDDWSFVKPVVIDLTDYAIHGEHTLRFRFVDSTTAADKKTSVLLRSIHFVENTIPVMYIDIDESLGTIDAMNADDDHETKCYGDLRIEVPDNWQSPYAQENDTYTGGSYSMEYIKGRGNSSWSGKKKPYKIKLDDSADLFHMGKNKHWVILADSFDESLLQNYITYHLAEELGLDYSIQCVKVEVYMNNIYQGIYTLAEQVRIDENRVELDDITDDYENLTDYELTGGYIIGMENNSKSKSYTFTTQHGQSYLVDAPESYGTVTYQKANDYIESHMQRIENAIFGVANEDGVVEDVWTLMDMESTVKYFWIQKFSGNTDAYETSSSYLYKPRDVKNEDGSITESKLYWGPVWDFDMAYDVSPSYYDVRTCVWLDQLIATDPVFVQALKDYWPTLREKIQEMIADGSSFDQLSQSMLPSAVNNFIKYPDQLIQDAMDITGTFTTKDFYKSIIEEKKDWCRQRIEVIDQAVEDITIPSVTVIYQVEGKTYYTGHEHLKEYNYDIPKDPVSSDSKKKFRRWVYQCHNFFDGSVENQEFTKLSRITKDDATLTEDGYVIYVNAEFWEGTDYESLQDLFFERSEYYVPYYSKDSDGSNSLTIYFSIYPEGLDENILKWSSSDSKNVGLLADEGCLYVDYKKPEDVTITATAPSGKTYQCQLHIIDYENRYEEEYAFQSMTLSDLNMVLTVGEYRKISVMTEPEKALIFNKIASDGLEWSSDNEDVVSVNKAGLLIAKSAGTANVFVLDKENAVFVCCKVTVKNKVVNQALKVGSCFNGKLKYKVAKSGKNPTVYVIGETKNYPNVIIPETVKYRGIVYQVTGISAKAFYKKSALKNLVIGKNVSYIGSKAFYKDNKLKKITINSTKLKSSNVGSKAFAKINAKVSVKVPKAKKKAYKSLLKKRGISGKKQKIK